MLSARITFRHVGKAAMPRGGCWFHEEWWCTPAQARHKQPTIKDLDRWHGEECHCENLCKLGSSGFFHTINQLAHQVFYEKNALAKNKMTCFFENLIHFPLAVIGHLKPSSEQLFHNLGLTLYHNGPNIKCFYSAMCRNFAECDLQVVHSLLLPFPIRFIWASLQWSSITWMAAFLRYGNLTQHSTLGPLDTITRLLHVFFYLTWKDADLDVFSSSTSLTANVCFCEEGWMLQHFKSYMIEIWEQPWRKSKWIGWCRDPLNNKTQVHHITNLSSCMATWTFIVVAPLWWARCKEKNNGQSWQLWSFKTAILTRLDKWKPGKTSKILSMRLPTSTSQDMERLKNNTQHDSNSLYPTHSCVYFFINLISISKTKQHIPKMCSSQVPIHQDQMSDLVDSDLSR